jgi:hypothetical protein
MSFEVLGYSNHGGTASLVTLSSRSCMLCCNFKIVLSHLWLFLCRAWLAVSWSQKASMAPKVLSSVLLHYSRLQEHRMQLPAAKSVCCFSLQYYLFMVFNVFLGVIVAGSALGQLKQVNTVQADVFIISHGFLFHVTL